MQILSVRDEEFYVDNVNPKAAWKNIDMAKEKEN